MDMNGISVAPSTLDQMGGLIKALGLTPLAMPTKIRFVGGDKKFELHTSGFSIKEMPGIQASLIKWTELSEFFKECDDFMSNGYVAALNGIYTIAHFKAADMSMANQELKDGISVLLDGRGRDMEGRPVVLGLFADTKMPKDERCVFVGCMLNM